MQYYLQSKQSAKKLSRAEKYFKNATSMFQYFFRSLLCKIHNGFHTKIRQALELKIKLKLSNICSKLSGVKNHIFTILAVSRRSGNEWRVHFRRSAPGQHSSEKTLQRSLAMVYHLTGPEIETTPSARTATLVITKDIF